jgi:hypothetical protein
VIGWHAVEGVVVAVTRVLRDVARAQGALVKEAFTEDLSGTRRGKATEGFSVLTGEFVEQVGAAVRSDVVVEEGAKGCARELEAGIEGGLDDVVQIALAKETETRIHEETKLILSVCARGGVGLKGVGTISHLLDEMRA